MQHDDRSAGEGVGVPVPETGPVVVLPLPVGTGDRPAWTVDRLGDVVEEVALGLREVLEGGEPSGAVAA